MIQGGHPYPQFRLAANKEPGDLQLGPLGYAKAALESYGVFHGWRERGAFRPGTRFQVSLPTPFAVVIPFFGYGRPALRKSFAAFPAASNVA
jgi:hypothetical protein